jgi:predicted secreted protein
MAEHIDDDVLPNPFFRAAVTKDMPRDVLLAQVERSLAGADPVHLDPSFMAKLEAAITAAGDTPARSSQAARLVARLRELKR